MSIDAARVTHRIVMAHLAGKAGATGTIEDLVQLIAGVGLAACNLNTGFATESFRPKNPAPITAKPSEAEIRASIRSDGLLSFEDGRRYLRLTRHLAARGLTPADYKEKWGLPPDYPMVCADYSRSVAARHASARRFTSWRW